MNETALNTLGKAEEALQELTTLHNLFETAKTGDPQAIAQILYKMGASYNGNLPQEFIRMFDSLKNSNGDISLETLKAFSGGGSGPSINEQTIKDLQQQLPTFSNLKMSEGVMDGRTSVETHRPLIKQQPIFTAWSLEMSDNISTTREKIFKLLEELAIQNGSNIYLEQSLAKLLINTGENHDPVVIQVIPDGFNGMIPKDFKGPLRQRLLAEGVLVTSPADLGIDINSKSKKIQRQIEGVNENLFTMKRNKKEALLRMLKDWQDQNPKEILDETRFANIGKVRDCTLNGSSQISEQVHEWILMYGLEATREGESEESFSINVSIGGDQVPPAYPEAYIIQPLQRLQALKELKDQGIIKILPTFDIISTMWSQVIENKKDHEGNPIEEPRHIYNSMVTLARMWSFIEKFFPDLKEYVRFHLFPKYKKNGVFKKMLEEATKALPITTEQFDNLFKIKGNLQNGDNDSINTYPARHAYSNGFNSPSHTLRFGAQRTEAPFHFVASMVSNILYPRRKSIHGQIGMEDVHATYYRQPQDPAMDTITRTGEFNPKLKPEDRSSKGTELQNAFFGVADAVGRKKFLKHMGEWKDRYMDPAFNDFTQRTPHDIAKSLGFEFVHEQNTKDYLQLLTD